jgi:hypothetical protein
MDTLFIAPENPHLSIDFLFRMYRALPIVSRGIVIKRFSQHPFQEKGIK